MIKRHVVKSCCVGGKAYLCECDTAVNRSHIDAFKQVGFVAPEQYSRSGVFYVEFKGLIATCAFGSTRLNVKCVSANCGQLLDMFETILDQLTHR